MTFSKMSLGGSTGRSDNPDCFAPILGSKQMEQFTSNRAAFKKIATKKCVANYTLIRAQTNPSIKLGFDAAIFIY